MSESQVNEFKQRLARLEKENRLLKTVGVVSLPLVVLVLVVLAYKVSVASVPRLSVGQLETLRVRKLTVVDDQDRERARLYADEWGTRLELVNPDEDAHAFLTVGQDGTKLQFWGANPTEETSVVLGSDPANGTYLELKNPDNGSTAALEVPNEGVALSLKDSDGFSSSLGTVWLTARPGGERTKTTAASLVLSRDGEVIWRSP
jgi:hypothetical protein